MINLIQNAFLNGVKIITLRRIMFLIKNVLKILNIFTDFKGPKGDKICTMGGVRGDCLGPPHGTTPAALIANEI